MTQSLRDQLIRNFNDVELKPFDRAPLYQGLRGASVAGARAGTVARKLGASFDIVPPGMRACPYHLHYAQEEMFVVIEGKGTLRVAGEMIPIRAGDVITIPPGPGFPHHILNTSDAPLKYLSISTMELPEVCEYPDSGKYLTDVGRSGGPLVGEGRMHRSDTDLDYWDGEP